jgi:hypothetical protein
VTGPATGAGLAIVANASGAMPAASVVTTIHVMSFAVFKRHLHRTMK